MHLADPRGNGPVGRAVGSTLPAGSRKLLPRELTPPASEKGRSGRGRGGTPAEAGGDPHPHHSALRRTVASAGRGKVQRPLKPTEAQPVPDRPGTASRPPTKVSSDMATGHPASWMVRGTKGPLESQGSRSPPSEVARHARPASPPARRLPSAGNEAAGVEPAASAPQRGQPSQAATRNRTLETRRRGRVVMRQCNGPFPRSSGAAGRGSLPVRRSARSPGIEPPTVRIPGRPRERGGNLRKSAETPGLVYQANETGRTPGPPRRPKCPEGRGALPEGPRRNPGSQLAGSSSILHRGRNGDTAKRGTMAASCPRAATYLNPARNQRSRGARHLRPRGRTVVDVGPGHATAGRGSANCVSRSRPKAVARAAARRRESQGGGMGRRRIQAETASRTRHHTSWPPALRITARRNELGHCFPLSKFRVPRVCANP